jgi:hypothetical protein
MRLMARLAASANKIAPTLNLKSGDPTNMLYEALCVAANGVLKGAGLPDIGVAPSTAGSTTDTSGGGAAGAGTSEGSGTAGGATAGEGEAGMGAGGSASASSSAVGNKRKAEEALDADRPRTTAFTPSSTNPALNVPAITILPPGSHGASSAGALSGTTPGLGAADLDRLNKLLQKHGAAVEEAYPTWQQQLSKHVVPATITQLRNRGEALAVWLKERNYRVCDLGGWASVTSDFVRPAGAAPGFTYERYTVLPGSYEDHIVMDALSTMQLPLYFPDCTPDGRVADVVLGGGGHLRNAVLRLSSRLLGLHTPSDDNGVAVGAIAVDFRRSPLFSKDSPAELTALIKEVQREVEDEVQQTIPASTASSTASFFLPVNHITRVDIRRFFDMLVELVNPAAPTTATGDRMAVHAALAAYALLGVMCVKTRAARALLRFMTESNPGNTLSDALLQVVGNRYRDVSGLKVAWGQVSAGQYVPQLPHQRRW